MAVTVVTGANKTQGLGFAGFFNYTPGLTVSLVAGDYLVIMSSRAGNTLGITPTHVAGNPATPTITPLFNFAGVANSSSCAQAWGMVCGLTGSYAFDINTNQGAPNSNNNGVWLTAFVLQGQHPTTPFYASDGGFVNPAIAATAPSFTGFGETGHGEALLLLMFGYGRVNLATTPQLTNLVGTGWTVGPAGFTVLASGVADPGGQYAYTTLPAGASPSTISATLTSVAGLIEQFVYALIRPAPIAGWPTKTAKVWLGSSWQPKPVKVWSGTAWVTKSPKVRP